MRKPLELMLSGILGFAAILPGCTPFPNASKETQKQIASHKLEDLCDTEIETIKKLNLHVYIESSERIWDYHEHKNEIFNYVKAFFQTYNIDCNVEFHENPLEKAYLECNEKGVEIYGDSRVLCNRYAELKNWKKRTEKKWASKNTHQKVGIAVTEKGTSLLNGGWEEWRDKISKEEAMEQFPESRGGIKKREYLIRQQAGNIVHETLHCLGLFHPKTFNPRLVPEDRTVLPNIMGYEAPFFADHRPTGKILIDIQKKLLHSFLAGNGAYKAFQSNDYNLILYLENIAHANKLKPVYEKPLCTEGPVIRPYKTK